jgi:transcriptional regulator with XRE-family HTH domain
MPDCERGAMPKSVFSAKYTRFREMLVEARKAKGLTQVDLALRLGRKQSYVSKFERGERRLDIVEFLEIAELLEIDVLRFVEKLL